ncbi:uncharacterized protein LOC108735060 isoform X2 [Agrilus planipennis]|uniref:Uncharacterized protein LOC108735060 isoform X2 n=1 Tax=Agrilus planipennis TaxID=224129 RepID=A0A7F5RM64_AGRPL|nr:uncharacterized protein LOC108735060 isoform X2 [Agrilus planipennis]
MSNKCFVPNCKNTTGVPFPKNQTIKQVWLDVLELKNLPRQDSFVCLDHFEPNSVNAEEICDTKCINKIKKGAIPTIRNPTKINKYEEKLEQDPKDSLQEKDVKTCRACMSEKDVEISILDYIEDDVTVMSTLMLCAFPLEISKHDKLPKHICNSCLNSLKNAHEFRKKCLVSDEILHERLTRKRRISTDNEEDNKKQKTVTHFVSDTGGRSLVIKPESDRTKIASLDLPEDDNAFEVLYEAMEDIQEENEECSITEDNGKEEETDGDPLEFVLESKIQIKTEKKSLTESETEEGCGDKNQNVENAQQRKRIQRITVVKNLGDKEHSFTPIKLQKQVVSAVDEIEKTMEVIHGPDTVLIEEDMSPTQKELTNKEKSSTEDIISTLSEGSSTNMTTKKVIIPGVKRQHYNNINVKSEQQPHPKKKIVVKTASVSTIRKEHSSVGRFPCNLREGVYDTVFVMADNYLFEYGLLKNSVRHLKCAVPNCGAHAEQKIIGDTFDNYLVVKIPHNHPSPNEATKKKQMFLSVMRRKIQTDKTLNIRSIYEDVCLQDPQIRSLVPLRNVINEVCRHQLAQKTPPINSFEDFYKHIEKDYFEKLHFTHSNQQFYQEKFHSDDGGMAIVFANSDVIQQLSDSKIMYVDASFKIDTHEDFKYQLVTVLVWIDDSYYPILFAIINKKTQEIFKMIFSYLYTVLAPSLRPLEIITDYEANLYYALAEVYVDSNIGGSVFYYTQNLYKKVCSLNLSRDLETNSFFRNIYHMLLMLPLLPVNTILDGLNNIELEARHMNISDLVRPLFDHIRSQWIINVTPDLFCVHKLENRINENVIAPFKKLRDFLLLTKGKMSKTQVTICHVIEKIIELEAFLRGTYSKPDKKSFGRDLSSFQKKNVLRAWLYIEDHPKIEINNFFGKVLGYIKCMENQLWIWGFYRYDGDTDDILINATHFSIVGPPEDESSDLEMTMEEDTEEDTVVMEAVVDQDGVLQTSENVIEGSTNECGGPHKQFENAFLKYVYQE